MTLKSGTLSEPGREAVRCRRPGPRCAGAPHVEGLRATSSLLGVPAGVVMPVLTSDPSRCRVSGPRGHGGVGGAATAVGTSWVSNTCVGDGASQLVGFILRGIDIPCTVIYPTLTETLQDLFWDMHVGLSVTLTRERWRHREQTVPCTLPRRKDRPAVLWESWAPFPSKRFSLCL